VPAGEARTIEKAGGDHPAPHALLYGPTAFGLLPLFAPAWLATGSALAAVNVMLLASLALTAWSAHPDRGGRPDEAAAAPGPR
jgi:hypothetical protein